MQSYHHQLVYFSNVVFDFESNVAPQTRSRNQRKFKQWEKPRPVIPAADVCWLDGKGDNVTWAA